MASDWRQAAGDARCEYGTQKPASNYTSLRERMRPFCKPALGMMGGPFSRLVTRGMEAEATKERHCGCGMRPQEWRCDRLTANRRKTLPGASPATAVRRSSRTTTG